MNPWTRFLNVLVAAALAGTLVLPAATAWHAEPPTDPASISVRFADAPHEVHAGMMTLLRAEVTNPGDEAARVHVDAEVAEGEGEAWIPGTASVWVPPGASRVTFVHVRTPWDTEDHDVTVRILAGLHGAPDVHASDEVRVSVQETFSWRPPMPVCCEPPARPDMPEPWHPEPREPPACCESERPRSYEPCCSHEAPRERARFPFLPTLLGMPMQPVGEGGDTEADADADTHLRVGPLRLRFHGHASLWLHAFGVHPYGGQPGSQGPS